MSKLIEFFTGSSLSNPYIVTPAALMFSLAFTMMLSGFMLIVYKRCHNSLTYNKNFNVTLLMLSFISTVLLALVQNNPLLSLGVLGSLSICRVRTNTKDPRDIGFIFWALTIGISSAVGAFAIGILSSLTLGCVLIVFNRTVKKKKSLMMVVRGAKSQIDSVQEMLGKTPGSIIQSKNIFMDSFELVYELRVKPKEEEFIISILNDMEGIQGVNVLAPETKVA